MLSGELNLQVRRPSTPGANQQVLFNNNGVDGTSPNLTFDGQNLTANIVSPGANQDVLFNNNGIIGIDTGNLAYNVANVTLTSQNIYTNIIENTTNTDWYHASIASIRLRNGGMTISGSGVISNTGQTLLLEANNGPSLGCYAPNGNANGLTIGTYSFQALDTDSLRQTYSQIQGVMVSNVANTIQGSITIRTAVGNTVASRLTVNGSSVGIGTVAPNSTLQITGNCNVTTNLVIGTSLNVKTTANITGVITANTTPITNTETRVITGLSANLTANVTTNGNSAQTNTLSVTFNEVGMYQIEAMLLFGSNTGNTTNPNVANGGMNIAFGNTGTATIATIKYAVQGRANGSTIISNLISTTAQTAILTSGQTFSNSTNGTDYLILTGYMNVSTTGTVNLAFASANSANLSFNVMPNTYIVYTKIG